MDYVDYIIITGDNPTFNSQLKCHSHHSFSTKHLGWLNFFLVIEASYYNKGVVLTQCKYTTELIRDSTSSNLKFHVIILPLNFKMSINDSTPLSNPTLYRSFVEKLNFSTHTRLDLSYSVQALSQHMQHPCEHHLQALKHTLCYLSTTIGQGILLVASDSLTLQAYSDSDWASSSNTRRSISDFFLLLGHSPISWKSKRRAIVSHSSFKAEYQYMANASAEVVWVICLLEELD